MNIGFIGVGHMASSILKALSVNEGLRFYVYDHHLDRMETLKRKYEGRVFVSEMEGVLSSSSFVFLGVKPKDMDELLEKIGKQPLGPVYVSMVAGYSLSEIRNHLPEVPLIRIMPNTPVSVGKGVTAVCYDRVDEKTKNAFANLYSPTGKLYEIDESQMDLYSVLTGSSPAYIDHVAASLVEFGMKHGLGEMEATRIVFEMIEGVASLGKCSGKTPEELEKEVCSPGGSTIEGIKVLRDENVAKAMVLAAEASLEKNKHMK